MSKLVSTEIRFEILRVKDAGLVVAIDVVGSIGSNFGTYYCNKFTYICWLEILFLYKLNWHGKNEVQLVLSRKYFVLET